MFLEKFQRHSVVSEVAHAAYVLMNDTKTTNASRRLAITILETLRSVKRPSSDAALNKTLLPIKSACNKIYEKCTNDMVSKCVKIVSYCNCHIVGHGTQRWIFAMRIAMMTHAHTHAHTQRLYHRHSCRVRCGDNSRLHWRADKYTADQWRACVHCATCERFNGSLGRASARVASPARSLMTYCVNAWHCARCYLSLLLSDGLFVHHARIFNSVCACALADCELAWFAVLSELPRLDLGLALYTVFQKKHPLILLLLLLKSYSWYNTHTHIQWWKK